MKNFVFIIILIAVPRLLLAQKTSTRALIYHQTAKQLSPKANNISLKRGKSYQFQIKGLNSAIYKPIFKTEAKQFEDEISGPVKELFGIDNISDLVQYGEGSMVRGKTQIDSLKKLSQKAFSVLEEIKQLTDSLYEKVKNDPQNVTFQRQDATNRLAKLLVKYRLDRRYASALKPYVESQLILIEQIANLTEKLVSSSADLSQKMVKNVYQPYFEIQEINSVAQKNKKTYLRSIQFLLDSKKAETSLKSEPFEATKDIIEFDMKIVNRITGDTLLNKKIDYYTWGGWSFDFSTGFFGNGLIEKAYYLQKDSLINIISEEGNKAIDISIGGMFHATHSVSPWWKVGFGIGAALSPIDGNTRYLSGISMVLGKKKLLAINGGYAIANLKVLSNQVQMVDGLQAVPTSVTEVPTYKQIQGSWFFGLSYNLSRKKKE